VADKASHSDCPPGNSPEDAQVELVIPAKRARKNTLEAHGIDQLPVLDKGDTVFARCIDVADAVVAKVPSGGGA
jgi:Ethanolamine utilization protein EutJ (predicted chaperonin)